VGVAVKPTIAPLCYNAALRGPLTDSHPPRLPLAKAIARKEPTMTCRLPIAIPALLLAAALSACADQTPTAPPPEAVPGETAPIAATAVTISAQDPAATVAAVALAELGAEAAVTDGGVHYSDEAIGEGPSPTACDTVNVHYTGRLPDGTEFDSSVDRGRPFAFVFGATPPQVIPGWEQGLDGMKVGGRRVMVIPPDLGYGATGGGPIPPNATLVFDVELVDVASPDAMPDAPAEVAAYETTDSGLQIAVLQEGDGQVAEAGGRVLVHYSGWLEDGTPFDSSLAPGRCGPIAFVLGQGEVVRGWDEGISGMKVGEKRQLRIPPELGYGSAGSGPIPPDATLVFDVELVGAP
jgi:peptidylprolyl isomerase